MDRSMATSKGHMKQQRKNLRTTQRRVETDKDNGATTDECYFAITAMASTGKLSQTRRADFQLRQVKETNTS